jgi:hypothetical protein
VSDTQQPDPKAEHSTGKTLGALGGIVVLLALLIFGVSQSKSAGASIITDAEQPSEAQYTEQADSLDYEKGILGEYDRGKLLNIKGSVNKILEKPLKGEANFVLNIRAEDMQNTNSIETKQVLLVFLEEPAGIEEADTLRVMGRYIGTLKYETAIGSNKEVPAIQVDYLK